MFHEKKSQHLNSKQSTTLESRCTKLEQQLSEIKVQLIEQQNKHRRAIHKTFSHLLATAIDAENQLEFTTHRLKRLESGKELRQLRELTIQLNVKLARKTKSMEKEKITCYRYSIELERLQEKHDALKKEFSGYKKTSTIR